MSAKTNENSKNDALTIAAVGVIVFALSSLIHEGFGHGGACLAVGCKPIYLSSMNFEGNEDGLSQTAVRFIASGGTLTNLFVGAAAFFIFPYARSLSVQTRYFIWLLASVNLLQAIGYPLFSGIGNIGDWAAVIENWQPWWLWRLILVIIGGLGYWYSVRLSLFYLGDFIDDAQTERFGRAQFLMLVPYFTGALLSALAGFFNPAGFALVLGSALPASLGGTSGLAWGSQLLRSKKIKPTAAKALNIPRNWSLIATAVAIGAIFVISLGRGINF